MRFGKCVQALFAILPIILLASCGGAGSSSNSSTGSQSASVFTVATDQPLASVISCNVTITGVTLLNSDTNTQETVYSGMQPIDFAKLSGLHQLMDLESVPTGTYTSATITLANPVIGFINVPGGGAAPTVQTVNGTPTTNQVTVTLNQPFMLSNGDLIGMRMDLDLHQSLMTDSSGNITGQFNPVFHVALLNSTDSGVWIDCFNAGVLGVTGATTFNVQGPLGRQWTVQTSSSTIFDDPDEPIADYTATTIVAISGQLDPVTKNIDAAEVQVVSNNGFYLGGLLTDVNPATGPATSVQQYVTDELPAINGLDPGDIATLPLTGTEIYRIGHINLPITQLIFNNSELAAGQRVSIGGNLNTSSGTPVLTPARVVLRVQGQFGTLAGNVVVNTGNNGTFQLTDNSMAGILLPNPLTVFTTNETNFINLSGLSALQGQSGLSLRVVGYVLIDQAMSPPAPIIVARSVEQLTSD